MSLANYTDLKAAIGNFAGRADLTARYDEFIALAEARLGRDLVRTGTGEIQNATTVTTLNQEWTDLPAMLGVRSVQIVDGSNYWNVDYLSPEELYRKYPTTATRRPRAMTIIGKDGGTTDVMRAIWRPLPDAAYNVNLLYYTPLTTLVGGSTNWFMTKNPDAYLYACLLEAAIFRKQDAEAQRWRLAYAAAFDDIHGADAARRHKGPLRVSPSVRMINGN